MEKDTNLLGELNSYYRTQMNILSKYLQIVWNRFNWFTTLNVGLISFYTTQADKETIHNILPKMGIALSMAWLIIGLMDYITVKKLNLKGKTLREKITKALDITEPKNFNKKSRFELMVSYIDSEIRQHFLLYLFPLIILLTWILLWIFN